MTTSTDSPPPKPVNDFAQFGRGLLMGGADIIPGVSGGTVALILGIYERLVTAISRLDPTLLSLLARRQLKDAAHHIDLRFLIPLGVGILSGVVILGSVMHTLLADYRQFTMAAFFGMIAASCYLVARLVEKWTPLEGILLVFGAIFAVLLVMQPALANPPDALWYVFLCGAIAICAMILPGISGAFILLILGKYEDITGIIKEVLKLKLSAHSIAVFVTFASGCLLGLISFSKLLKWLLTHKANQTMSLLCGFMIGSLYKIWPFQIDTTPEVEEFKHKIFQPIPLSKIRFDGPFAITITILLASALFILLLDHFGQPKNEFEETVEDRDEAPRS